MYKRQAQYRVLVADQPGNAGPNAITVNRAGNSFIDGVTNPRSASGYAPAEGSTDESLELVKISGPATLRGQSKGITAADIEALVAAFPAADGARPFARALGGEEGARPHNGPDGRGRGAPSLSTHLASRQTRD